MHFGTGSLLLLGQGQATLRLHFICPAVCLGSVPLLSGSDMSQASASLSPDLLHAVLPNLGSEGKQGIGIHDVLRAPLAVSSWRLGTVFTGTSWQHGITLI